MIEPEREYSRNQSSNQTSSQSNQKATQKNPKDVVAPIAEPEDEVETEQALKAGTGFMQTLCDAIKSFEIKGYKENLICCFDHLKSQCRRISIMPSEIDVKDIYRFENSSDPSDQSILYAISIPSKNMKGLYIESYGIYHEDQSETLRKALRLFR